MAVDNNNYQSVLKRVNFNPYSYLGAPKVDGINVVKNEPIKLCTEKSDFDIALEKAKAQQFKEEMAAKGIVVLTSEDLKPIEREFVCPFGSASGATLMKLGELLCKKFYDFTNSISLDEMKVLANNADYTGMSKAEIYTAIYDRYSNAYGDFLPSRAISYVSLYPDNNYAQIYEHFLSELRSVFGSTDAAWQANKTAQYGNMNDTEIRAAIAAKYPSMDKITLREFHYMVSEMSDVGVDDGMSSVLSLATSYSEYTGSGVSGAIIREELLDKPLDVQRLCRSYSGLLNTRSVTSDTGRVLQELFDVNFDRLGNAFSNRPSPINFNALINQIVQSRKGWTDADYKNWLSSRS